MFKAEVRASLKKGITDPEGENVLKALHLLGFDEVREVKISKITTMMIDEKNKSNAIKRVENMCNRLLTNPVIHDYEINVFNVEIKGKNKKGKNDE